MFSILPPEDTGGRSTTHQKTVFLLAKDTPNIGVHHFSVQFVFGESRVLVDTWTASFDTPSFVVHAYDTQRCIALMEANNVVEAARFANMITSIVSMDASERVRTFAQALQIPLFESKDALYWAIHDSVTSAELHT